MGDAKYWEDMINNNDHDTFFRSIEIDHEDKVKVLRGTKPMPKNYLHFVYGYTVCCGDRKKLTAWLTNTENQASDEVHVFKKITPSDEAWAIANLVNNYDGWCKKFDKLSDMSHEIHKQSLGKWTSLKKDSSDEVTVKKAGRMFARSGWHKDGMEFYNKAVCFFKLARKDDRIPCMAAVAGTCILVIHAIR